MILTRKFLIPIKYRNCNFLHRTKGDRSEGRSASFWERKKKKEKSQMHQHSSSPSSKTWCNKLAQASAPRSPDSAESERNAPLELEPVFSSFLEVPCMLVSLFWYSTGLSICTFGFAPCFAQNRKSAHRRCPTLHASSAFTAKAKAAQLWAAPASSQATLRSPARA